MRNILIAGLVHETHTFLKEETTLSDFEDLIWLKGQEMVDYCRGDLSPMSGMLEVADRFGWHVFASTYGVAMPSGIVDDDEVYTPGFLAFGRKPCSGAGSHDRLAVRDRRAQSLKRLASFHICYSLCELFAGEETPFVGFSSSGRPL